jgi:integrase
VIARTPDTIRDAARSTRLTQAAFEPESGQPASTIMRGRGRPRRTAEHAANEASTTGKPYKSFPLTAHRNGQFVKKIRGKLYYFGSVKDPDAALSRYHEHCAGLHSGRISEVRRDAGITVGELANRFLAAAEARRDAGELSQRTFVDYYRDCERLVGFFGRERGVDSITRDDLKSLRKYLARGVNPETLNGRIGVTRSIFKFAYEEELVEKPVRFGKDLKRPERRLLRRSRADAGRKHFLAGEIRTLLDAAPLQLRAMILLGINCGMGNLDVAALPANCIDVEHGWIDYPRAKTGVRRRCPLWPETVEAIVAVQADRQAASLKPTPETQGLLFVTRRGHPFVRSAAKVLADGRPHVVEHDAIATTLKRIMDRKGIAIRGLGFYGLRRSFETIGAETGNQVAVDHIMGHVPATSDMGAVYRQHVAESALRQVTSHVHTWLFGAASDGEPVATAVKNNRGATKPKTSVQAGDRKGGTPSGRARGRNAAPRTRAGRRTGS